MIDATMQLISDMPFEGAMSWAAGWLLRGSLFIGLLVLFALPLARKSSSSVRHLLWAAGFTAVVALPFASLGLPRWEVAVPASILPASPQESVEEPAPARGLDVGEPGHETSLNMTEGSEVSEMPLRSTGAGSRTVSWREGARWDLSILPPFLFLLWWTGALFFLLRFGGSMVSLAGIVRRADRASHPEWERTLFELADRMDLPNAPRLVESDEVTLPMTCGLLTPTIILPRTAAEWSSERLDAVLSHELAHIRRRDLVTHLLGHIGSALYWVNPLSWKAARELRAESERACDDLVLSLGMRPSTYADHLLQIATVGLPVAAPVAALPMARRGEFEERLLSILAPFGNRRRPRAWQAGSLALGVLALAVPFAVLAPALASGESATSLDSARELQGSESSGAGEASAPVGGDTLLAIAMEVHVPNPHQVSEPHSVEANVSSPEHLDVEVRSSVNENVLASFIERITTFAGVVAGEAVTSALTGLNADLDLGIDLDNQDRLEGEFERTLTLNGPLALDISTGSGGIDIREGNVNRIVIRGQVRVGTRRRGSAGAAELLQRLTTTPPIEQRGNSVTVGRIQDRELQEDVSISYEVVVPVRSMISSSTGSGSVTVRGVQGNLQATTGSGSVTLTSITGDVYARTGSGSIRATEVEGAFDGSTGSGSIDVTLRGTGDISLTTGSGSISASGVMGALHAETGSGRITVGGEMRGRWELRSGSGSVTVGLPPQAAFNLVARAGSGRVNIDHPLTIQGTVDPRMQEVSGTIRGGGPELNIRTGSGSIRID
jgi:beta-lactamase regulating signal transducer with metallopeptidase domain